MGELTLDFPSNCFTPSGIKTLAHYAPADVRAGQGRSTSEWALFSEVCELEWNTDAGVGPEGLNHRL